MAAIQTKFVPGLQLANADGDTLNELIGVVNGGASIDGAVVTTGTSRAGAYVVADRITQVTSAVASAGLVLPAASVVSGSPLNPLVIFNAGSASVAIYASGADTVDGSAGSAGTTLSAGARAEFYAVTSGGFVSTQLGVASA